MLLRQFCLGSNLSMHIRTNTDFLWQKPWQLPSVEATFEDWKVGGGGGRGGMHTITSPSFVD